MTASTCKPGLFGLERVRYFPRQLITADDMTTEQDYFRQRDRRHNRFLHGWGVVCGLTVEVAPDSEHPWRVRVCPGYAIGPQGDEISVADPVYFDIATGASDCEPCQPWPCPPSNGDQGDRLELPVFLAIRHSECDSRPVRVHPLGCGCDEMVCEYSRVRDDFEIKVLQELPASHREAAKADQEWLIEWKAWRESDDARLPPPAPPCRACPADPWVVIAAIRLPDKPVKSLVAADLSTFGRRVLYSAATLQSLVIGGL